MMLQMLCVRRCLFVPIYEMLDDTCSSMLSGAIAEERLSGDSLYQDAVGEAKELVNDAEFSKYLEDDDTMHELQVQNLHRTFSHCEEFAKRNGMRTVVGSALGTDEREDDVSYFTEARITDRLSRDSVDASVKFVRDEGDVIIIGVTLENPDIIDGWVETVELEDRFGNRHDPTIR